MSRHTVFDPTPHRDPLSRAAIVVALIALLFSMTGGAPASRGVDKRQGKRGSLAKLKVGCPIPNAVDLGTWCLESGFFPVPPKDIGKNNYVYAARACVKAGGWLPSAAQLIGASSRAKLASTIDDNFVTATVDEFPAAKNGIKDKREMTGDLFTTTAGSEAAGSEVATAGSRGNTSLVEPDPVPVPSLPMPDTLDYLTVYDNHNQGGFAGGVPVGTPENFRCAYAKGSQGRKFGD